MASQVQLPPWLQINPEQFTQAAIAGGQQGYSAAAEAGSLAQRGLISAVQLAQESAAKAAEIAVRREQINAELAQNAARVSAARAEAAAQNSIRQQQVDLARIAEENQRVNEAARIQSALDINAANIQGEKDVAGIRANAPQTFAPSDEVKTLEAIKRFRESGDNASADILENILKKRGTTTPTAQRITPDKAAELKAYGERLAEINLKLSAPGKTMFTREEKPPDPDLIKERDRLRALMGEIVTPIETPAMPVGGPLRYQLINGQYQITQ